METIDSITFDLNNSSDSPILDNDIGDKDDYYNEYKRNIDG